MVDRTCGNICSTFSFSLGSTLLFIKKSYKQSPILVVYHRLSGKLAIKDQCVVVLDLIHCRLSGKLMLKDLILVQFVSSDRLSSFLVTDIEEVLD